MDGLEEQKESVRVRAMFSSIAPSYDRANTVLSFGIHYIWKRLLAKRVAQLAPRRVVDLCTGTGDVLSLLRREGCPAWGADFCLPMLEEGTEKGRNVGRVMQADALMLPLAEDSVDAVTVAFGVRNFSDLDCGLREIRRVLRQGGSIFVFEFGQPAFAPWRAVYGMYQRYWMPIIGGALSGNFGAYRYLPKTSQSFPSGKAFEQRMVEAGFRADGFTSLSGGIAYLYKATKQ